MLITPRRASHAFELISNASLIMSNGILYCGCCKKALSWNAQGSHLISDSHINTKDVQMEVAADLDYNMPIHQQHIIEEDLVCRMYTKDKIDSILL